MCGRYGQFSRRARLEQLLGLEPSIGGDLEARYNIAPGTNCWIVRTAENARTFQTHLWGLTPSWAKDPGLGPHPVNARAESAHARPMFRALMRERRCLVPADGFYEWKTVPSRKIPYWICMAGQEPFFFAALWDCWRPDKPERISSFTILTTGANERMAPIHERMPVIVHKKDYDLWLDPKITDPASVARVLRPYDASAMIAYPVSKKVNNVKNGGPELIAPVAVAKETS